MKNKNENIFNVKTNNTNSKLSSHFSNKNIIKERKKWIFSEKIIIGAIPIGQNKQKKVRKR